MLGDPFVNLSDRDRRKVRAAVRRDSLFLRRQGLMDYSLLLAVERRTDIRLRGASHLASGALDRSLMNRDSINSVDIKASYGSLPSWAPNPKIKDDESFRSNRSKRAFMAQKFEEKS